MKPATATAAPSLNAARKRFRVSGTHQRRVGEHHENIVEAAREALPRRQHRMRGAEPLRLPCDLGRRNKPQGLLLDRIVIGPDHHRAGLRTGVARPRAAHG